LVFLLEIVVIKQELKKLLKVFLLNLNHDVGVGVGSPVDVGVGVGSPVDVGVGVGSPVDVVSEKVKVLQCLTIGVGTDVATYVGSVVAAPGRLVGAVGATDSCLSL